MIRKVASRRYLEKLAVLIEDTSPLSSYYFDVAEYPQILQAGKNLLRLRGGPNLESGTQVYVEVLDANGNPVFCDTLETLNADKSRTIAIWIYPETASGKCTITLVGTANRSPNGELLADFQKQTPNVRWTARVGIDSATKNSSEIVFTAAPTVTITELSRSLFTKTYPISRFVTGTVTGSLSYSYYNGDTILASTTDLFNGDMIGGQVTISSSLFTNLISVPTIKTSAPTFYTASIEKVLNTRSIRLSNPYSVPSTELNGRHTYRGGSVTTASIYYEASPTLTSVTQSSLVGSHVVTGSFALLTIEGMDPASGDVNRVQVYLRKTSAPGVTKEFNGYDSPGNYIKVADTVVQSREVLIDANSPLIDAPLGIVTSATFGAYETAPSKTLVLKHVSASLPLDIKSYPLINSIFTKSASGVPSTLTTNEYFILKITGSFSFQQNTVYNLSFDAVTESDSTINPALGYQLLDAVLSGSACTDSYLDETNAKYIGTISNEQGGYLFENNSFDFTVPKTGTAQLMFLIRAGAWSLTNISIKPRQELGFTPNKLELLFPIEQYANDTYDVKVEYCDYLGNVSKTVSEIKNFTFKPTPLRINQLYADNVVANTIYSSASIVTGSIHLTGSLYYQGRKQYNFGQFYDTTTQSGSRNIPYAMKLNTTDISEGVSITSNGSGHPTRITVANSGYYNLQFSAQLYNTNNSNLLYTIWFRVNGTDIPNSATNVEVVKNAGVQGQLVAAWNFLHYLSGSQYIEIMWAYDDGSDSGQLLYLPSSSIIPHPAIPSLIATMIQIA